ncbi:hypothetical protein [Novipirellula sp.]|uniref:hypothetical protein n=1 Tax=Novipirellula sp. TaxID=2795430 RepID=UPI00356B173E
MLLLGMLLCGSPLNAATMERYSLTFGKTTGGNTTGKLGAKQKSDDRGEIKLTDKQLQIQIFSSVGIGQLKLHRSAAETSWPQTVVLLIQHKPGKPLAELEGFTLRGKSILIQGSRRTSGAMDQFILTDEGAKFQNLPSQKANIRVSRTKDAMRVEIPGELLSAETEIEIQWIDYYRS